VLVHADLESCTVPVAEFDVILCFYYLQRSLFAPIHHALRPGGMLVYESYTLDQLNFPGGPHNPEHLLNPGELREAFRGLQTLFYREFRVGKGIASLLARRPV
jgi:SAM-dependent methyltransferase